MMKRMGMAVLVAMAAGLGACESATGLEGGAAVEVAAHGDASGEAGSAAASEGGSGSQQSSSSRAEGTVDFRARVWVRTSSNAWVELTQGAAKHAQVDASGRQGAKTFHTARTEAQSYNRVRIEFEEVKANVTGGVMIGTSLLSGEVRVDASSSNRAVVERSIQMDTRSTSGTTLVIDLNAREWLSRANAQSRTASRAEFESAVRVLVK
jgi:hypothetical protein